MAEFPLSNEAKNLILLFSIPPKEMNTTFFDIIAVNSQTVLISEPVISSKGSDTYLVLSKESSQFWKFGN